MEFQASSHRSSDKNLKLLPHLIEHYASNEPGRVYALRPFREPDSSVGFKPVTYITLARAIDRAAWWLDDHLESEPGQIFTYHGPQDIRWAILCVAAIKTGRIMLCLSEWIRNESLISLMDSCGCSIILSNGHFESGSPFGQFLAERSLVKHCVVPSLDEWITAEDTTPRYRYAKQWHQAADDRVIICHTSGTTGIPKAVPLTNRRIALFGLANDTSLTKIGIAVPDLKDRIFYTNFPMPHIGGLSFQLFWPVYLGATMVTAPPGEKPTAPVSYEVLRTRIATAAALTPDLLHQAHSFPQYLESVRSLEVIIFGAGTLSSVCAQRIMENGGPNIQNFYGCSESWPSIQGPGLLDDPRYLHFHAYGGYEMRPRSDELFELVIKRCDRLKDFQSGFMTFPDMDEFATRDLFSQHPQHQAYWRHRGRVDDMIVVGPGVNLHVSDLERAIEEHAMVRSALICNSNCGPPIVILDPATPVPAQDGQMEESLAAAVWPTIEAANGLCTNKIRLRKDLAIVAKEAFIRTAKGSVDRASTLRRFKQEIDEAYKVHNGSPGSDIDSKAREAHSPISLP